jgi:hypothetical protein
MEVQFHSGLETTDLMEPSVRSLLLGQADNYELAGLKQVAEKGHILSKLLNSIPQGLKARLFFRTHGAAEVVP